MISRIKKILNSQKPGSAIFIFLMMFFGIFVIAFGSSYLIFLSLNQSSNFSDGLKSYYAARSGWERAKYEAIKNNYNFAQNCQAEILSAELPSGSSYAVNCVNEGGLLTFYSLGQSGDSQAALAISGINIEDECLEHNLNGSLCGGGKLLNTSSLFVLSPSNCAESSSCDFSTILDVSRSWSSASDYCAAAQFNGFDDWYLPDIDQLSSLKNYSSYFVLNKNCQHWSSSESGSNSYTFNFLSASSTLQDKAGNYCVRCVRNIQ